MGHIQVVDHTTRERYPPLPPLQPVVVLRPRCRTRRCQQLGTSPASATDMLHTWTGAGASNGSSGRQAYGLSVAGCSPCRSACGAPSGMRADKRDGDVSAPPPVGFAPFAPRLLNVAARPAR